MIGNVQGSSTGLDHALKICETCCQTEPSGSSHAGLACSACPVFEFLSDEEFPLGSDAQRLSGKDKALVQKSFAQLQPYLDLFACAFYDALFAQHPHVRFMFSGDQGEQRRKLAAMLTTMVKGLDRMESAKPAIWALGRRHVHYGVRPIDYAIFWNVLLMTLEAFLQENFTSDVQKAWKAFYRCMSSIMLGTTDRHLSMAPGVRRVA